MHHIYKLQIFVKKTSGQGIFYTPEYQLINIVKKKNIWTSVFWGEKRVKNGSF